MKKRTYILPLAALALVASAGTGFVAVANAAAPTTATGAGGLLGTHTRPVAVGTVSAINGTSITLTDAKNSTTYTVDATNATVMKMGGSTTAGTRPQPTTITVAQIAVGDTLRVQGTLSGTTVTATKIMDGVFRVGLGGPRGRAPGVHGTVSSISGNTIVVAGSDGKTYTIDASGATVGKMTTIPVSGIVVGDQIGVDGTVNGTSVTAGHIMDGVPPAGPKAPTQ